jgi:general secretion pathway protein M
MATEVATEGTWISLPQARLQRAVDTVDNSAGTVSGTVRMDQALGAKEAS